MTDTGVNIEGNFDDRQENDEAEDYMETAIKSI